MRSNAKHRNIEAQHWNDVDDSQGYGQGGEIRHSTASFQSWTFEYWSSCINRPIARWNERSSPCHTSLQELFATVYQKLLNQNCALYPTYWPEDLHLNYGEEEMRSLCDRLALTRSSTVPAFQLHTSFRFHRRTAGVGLVKLTWFVREWEIAYLLSEYRI